MKFGVYSIRDAKTGFLSPAFEVNDQVAMRNFVHAVSNSDSVLFSHARDFDLYKIGTFDSDTGRIMPIEIPVMIISGASVLKGD